MSTTRAKRTATALIGGLSLAAIVACGTKVNTSSSAPPPPPSRTPPAASTAAGLPLAKGMEYTENDFVESDHNRDPFRPYVAPPQGPKQITNQRTVKFGQYSVDELKLTGIIMAGDGARAMFVPPTGKADFVSKGDYLCRPETVHVGGSNGPEYQINWRVERIRSGDVVLIREDATNPLVPPATRVIPLHNETNPENPELAGQQGIPG